MTGSGLPLSGDDVEGPNVPHWPGAGADGTGVESSFTK